MLDKWLAHGLRLRSGADGLGVPFFYDLLTESLEFAVFPEDSPQQWGCLLLRLLPEKDLSKESHPLMLLRVLAANPELARSCPKVVDKKAGDDVECAQCFLFCMLSAKSICNLSCFYMTLIHVQSDCSGYHNSRILKT